MTTPKFRKETAQPHGQKKALSCVSSLSLQATHVKCLKDFSYVSGTKRLHFRQGQAPHQNDLS